MHPGKPTRRTWYRVAFHHQGKIYEIYARSIGPASLPGFVEVAELEFGGRSSVVVDPGAEQLAKEFEGVRRFYLPYHAVVRVDEVEHEGASRIRPAEGAEGGTAKIRAFPALEPGAGSDKNPR